MSALVATKASTLAELLADFGVDTRSNNAYDDSLIKIENFAVWSNVENSFMAPVVGCGCFRLPDEEESPCVL